MIVCLAAGLASAPAPAEASPRLARRHMRQAKVQLKRGRYDAALASCRRAYGRHSDPDYILWMARINARANRMGAAAGA